MSSKTAVIAGGGITGVTLAAALSQRGWDVTVHERSPELREFGAGIWLWSNGIRALQAVGAFDTLLASGPVEVAGWNIRDAEGRVVHSFSHYPTYIPERQSLYQALLDSARHAGARFITGSDVQGATRAGDALVLSDGSHVEADLLVGADGVNSSVRSSLGLTVRRVNSSSRAMRVLVPRMNEDSEWAAAEEHWSANRTLLVCPTTADTIYLCFVCSEHDNDAFAAESGINRESWSKDFPGLESLIERAGQGRWDSLSRVYCKSWSVGHVAIVGDAAHAMPPTLGQAANTALGNAVSLAYAVSKASSTIEGISEWERDARPLTEHVQRWSRYYAVWSHMLPERFDHLRMRLVRFFGSRQRVADGISLPAREQLRQHVGG